MKRIRRHRTLTLSSDTDRYGWIRFVTTPELRNRAIEYAGAHGVSLSDVVRSALIAYLDDGVATVRGWSENDVRDAVRRVAKTWTRQPVELEGDVMLVFGITPKMVDQLVEELYRQGRRPGRPTKK